MPRRASLTEGGGGHKSEPCGCRGDHEGREAERASDFTAGKLLQLHAHQSILVLHALKVRLQQDKRSGRQSVS